MKDSESEAPDIRANRLASEMMKRVKGQRALGTPSFYNIAREVLIEEFASVLRCICGHEDLIGISDFAFHTMDCPVREPLRQKWSDYVGPQLDA